MMMLEGLPFSLWPDSWLWMVRSSILRGLPRVGPSHDALVGRMWLENIEVELRARGFRFPAYWSREHDALAQSEGVVKG